MTTTGGTRPQLARPPAEVELGRAHGLLEPSAANCDWLITVAKDRLLRQRGQLDPVTIRRLDAALVVALGLDVG